jgi:hypothetical protein
MSEKDREAIIDFCSALEAACVKLKHDLGVSPGQGRYSWDPKKIGWTDKQGDKGPYQMSEDVNNLEFKAMLKDLASHKGKLAMDGKFYWVFANGTTVGRKDLRRKAP